MKVMIDTCIIIDYIQNRMPFADNSQKIIELALEGKIDGFFSAKSITDVNYVIRKYLHDPLEVNLYTGYIWQICDVLDTTESDVFNAMFSQMCDFEDAVLCEMAKRNHLDAIVTRNKEDFTNAGITVYSPEELIKLSTS